MAFRVPAMPLTCNIWRQGNPYGNPPDVVSRCNLSMGRRVQQFVYPATTDPSPTNPAFEFLSLELGLLLPKGTDIRPAELFGIIVGDMVEVPAGTGRWYWVTAVDDVGKGFANEYRFAVVTQLTAQWLGKIGSNWGSPPPWPAPIP